MLFTLFVNDQQTAHRLTLEGAQEAADRFIAKGDSVRIQHRDLEKADQISIWHYDSALAGWVRKGEENARSIHGKPMTRDQARASAIRDWMALPAAKRRAKTQMIAFAIKHQDDYYFRSAGEDKYQTIAGWLEEFVGRD